MRRRRRYLFVRIALFVIFWLLVAVVALGGSAFYGLMAAPVNLTPPAPPRTALLLDSSNAVFGTIRPTQSRQEVPADQIPQVLRNAIMAAEDERFLDHSGVDPLSIARAAWNDVTGQSVQGGSTITQQYVKNTFVGSQRTSQRKFKEAAIAIRLEQKVPKQEILTRYLNTLYLGNSTYGVQAASQYYFGIDVSKLDLSQASLLAGIAPAPTEYNPVASLDKARDRQQYVLDRMIANGMISAQQASDAYAHPPTIVAKVAGGVAETSYAPEFHDYAISQVKKLAPQAQIDTAGLRIQTTLDPNWQKAMQQAVKQVLPADSDPQEATIAIDYTNGNVVGMTTRKDGGYQFGGFNNATDALRSTGSAIKPFTLATAVQQGHSPNEIRPAPNCITEPYYLDQATNKPQAVCNDEGDATGNVTLAYAMWHSLNTVYMPLAHDVKNAEVAKLAAAAGAYESTNPRIAHAYTVPSMGLGIPTTPISMVQAYATLANGGVRNDLHAIASITAAGDGSTAPVQLKLPANQTAQAMPAPVANTVAQVLQGVVTTGTAAGTVNLPFPTFGKTGTVEADQDAWFIGCPTAAAVAAKQAPPVCIGTWMGYEKNANKSMLNVEGVAKVQGGTLPAKIFNDTWLNYLQLTQPPAPVATAAPTPSAPTPRAPRTPAQSATTPATRPSAVTVPTPAVTTPGGVGRSVFPPRTPG